MTFPKSYYKMLRIIRDNPNVPRRALSEEYGADYQSASIGGSLHGLERAGYIHKTKAKLSRRVVSFEITPKGLLALTLVDRLEEMERDTIC